MDFAGLLHNLGPLTVTGLAQGAIYALFALGYTLVYGLLRLINFAHSEVFTIGTYASLNLWQWGFGLDQNSKITNGWTAVGYIALGIGIAAVASGILALVIEVVAYRPLRRRNAPPLVFLITAIGASTVISEAIGIATHRAPKGVPLLVQPKSVISFGNTHITNLEIMLVVLALVMMFALDRFINTTRLGRGIRAVAQSPDSAALMGVNKNRIISLVFLLGGLMAGVAAVMYVLKIGGTKYDAGFTLGIQAFTAAVLGGIGNLRGALVGGLFLGVAENWASGLFGTQWRTAVAFVLLVVILMFRPTGILGESLGRARA